MTGRQSPSESRALAVTLKGVAGDQPDQLDRTIQDLTNRPLFRIPQTPNQQFMKEFLYVWGMLQGYVGFPLETRINMTPEKNLQEIPKLGNPSIFRCENVSFSEFLIVFILYGSCWSHYFSDRKHDRFQPGRSGEACL